METSAIKVEGSTKTRFRERAPSGLNISTTSAYRAKRKILDEDEADYNRSFELIEAWLNDVKAKNSQTETVFMSE